MGFREFSLNYFCVRGMIHHRIVHIPNVYKYEWNKKNDIKQLNRMRLIAETQWGFIL